MENDHTTEQKDPGPWRHYADASMFLLGLAGAAWEIFVDKSQNWYIYALILALLRLGPEILDRVERIAKK
jgi:hypothetical protein